MKVAVIGTGNVGWALVANLAQRPDIDQILVSSRSQDRVEALIMDICSANPKAFGKIRYAEARQISDADVIVLTSGVQMKPGQTARDVREPNIGVTRESLSGVQLKPSAILITLATPVDDITIFAQLLTGHPHRQVFGFGGNLDRNRLEYVLRTKGMPSGKIELVGEHGGNAIPVYPGEEQYEDVAKEVRGFLRRVTSLAGGETRNLSTAVLLSELIESIAQDSRKAHYLCGFHPEYGIYLTWKFAVGRAGISAPEKIAVSGKAKDDLDALVVKRRETGEVLKGFLLQSP